VSLETDKELPTRKLPVKLPSRKLSVERPAERKQSKRKAKFKNPLADTEGRYAGLVSAVTSAAFAAQAGGSTTSAYTPTDLPAQVGTPSKSADTPAAHLSQAGRSAVMAYSPMEHLSQVCLPTGIADTSMEHLFLVGEAAALPRGHEEVPAAPEDMPAPLEGRADTSEDVPASPDEVIGMPKDGMAHSPGDRQPGVSLLLSALQAGAEEEMRVKKDAATTTGRQATQTALTPLPLPLHSLQRLAVTLSLGLLSPLGKPLSPLRGRGLRTSGQRTKWRISSRTRKRSGSRR
jgi:hypothetical protein